jgi:hypothetical protein
MKKTRLLEIIREEITFALRKAATTYAGKSATDDLKKDKAFSSLTGDAKADALEKLNSGGTVTIGEEEQLNEVPDFGGRFDKQVAAKYGEEDTLEAATEKITNRVLSDKGISKADVAKMDKDALKALLKDIRAFISQKKQAPEAAAALEKQKEFDDSGSNLQDNQTNKAILRALGFESKKGPKGPTKAKTEKAPKAKAEKAEKPAKEKPEPKSKAKAEEEDTEEIDDSTYYKSEEEFGSTEKEPSAKDVKAAEKEFGNVSSDKLEKFNTGLKFIKKYKDDKKVIDAYLKKAKDEYKLPANMIKDLKRAAGRNVEA